jgi:hypothetical protein
MPYLIINDRNMAKLKRVLHAVVTTPFYLTLAMVLIAGAVLLSLRHLRLESQGTLAAGQKFVRPFQDGKNLQNESPEYIYIPANQTPGFAGGGRYGSFDQNSFPKPPKSPITGNVDGGQYSSTDGSGPVISFYPRNGQLISRSQLPRSARVAPVIDVDFGDTVTALGYALFLYPGENEFQASADERDIRCPNGEKANRYSCAFRFSPRLRNMPNGAYTLVMYLNSGGTYSSTFTITD